MHDNPSSLERLVVVQCHMWPRNKDKDTGRSVKGHRGRSKGNWQVSKRAPGQVKRELAGQEKASAGLENSLACH